MSADRPLLITEDYRKAQQELHENPNYGMASTEYAPLVAEILEACGADELLDYGAGKGRLAASLPRFISRELKVHLYDPAIPQWANAPKPCRFVACIDVLEHIEPDLIENVLDDLRRVTLAKGLFTVHTGPAMKVLRDGRNAHLVQQPPSWWLPRLMSRFELIAFQRMEKGFWVLVEHSRLADPGGFETATLVARLTSFLRKKQAS